MNSPNPPNRAQIVAIIGASVVVLCGLILCLTGAGQRVLLTGILTLLIVVILPRFNAERIIGSNRADD